MSKSMHCFEAQAQRIREKIVFARSKDSDYQVFGASSHRYRLAAPLPISAIVAIEESGQFELPDALRAFYGFIGNGPVDDHRNVHRHGGAGPFYGVQSLQSLVTYVELKYLNRPCTLHPYMTHPQWQERVDTEFKDDGWALYNGLLAFGTQGCSFNMALVVNGPFAGRVVYVDEEMGDLPIFCSDSNFMDWYERWLDELLADHDLQDFGNGKGGEELTLIADFKATDENAEALFVLRGFHKFRHLQSATLAFLRTLLPTTEGEVRSEVFNLLVKYDFANSAPHIADFLVGTLDQQFAAVRHLRGYERPLLQEWVQMLSDMLADTSSLELCFEIAYLLINNQIDVANGLHRFLTHPSADSRRHAIWLLGTSIHKAQHRAKFLYALGDQDTIVQRAALHALADLSAPDLLPSLQRLIVAYPSDKALLSSVVDRLGEIGSLARPLLLLTAGSGIHDVAEKSREILRIFNLSKFTQPLPPKPQRGRIVQWLRGLLSRF